MSEKLHVRNISSGRKKGDPVPRDREERSSAFPRGLGDHILRLQKTIGNQAVQRLRGSSQLMPNPEGQGPEASPVQGGTGGPERLPASLSPEELAEAVSFNRAKFRKAGSVRIIQELVEVPVNGRFDRETIEGIVQFQTSQECFEQEGLVGEGTLETIIEGLKERGRQNEAIHLVMDYHKLPDVGALRSIRYNPDLMPSDATTTPVGQPPCDSEVEIGPEAFRYLAYLVHTIAHELEHVRQNKVGGISGAAREFLGEAREVLSEGMPLERFADFMDDARRALFEGWLNMTLQERSRYWRTFQRMRGMVLERFQKEYSRFEEYPAAERWRQTKERYESARDPSR